MADSFFGFDSALSNLNERDDGGGGLEASEDEYDALNDETFGEAGEDGDWEQQHEELLLSENDKQGQDLEAFLSHLVLEDYDDYNSPRESPQHKSRESKPNAPPHKRNAATAGYTPSMPQLPSMAMASSQQNVTQGVAPHPGTWLKNACTVEELERSMRQQTQPQPPPQTQPHHVQHQMPLIMPFYQPRFPPGVMPPASGPPLGIQNHSLPHQHQQHQHPHMPPGFGGPPPHHPHHFPNYNQMAPMPNGMMPQSILPRPPQPQSQLPGQNQGQVPPQQPPPQPGSLQAIEHQQQQQQQNNLHHPLQNQNQNQVTQQGQNIWQQPPQNMLPNIRMPLNNVHPLQQMQSMPPPLRQINPSGGPPMQNVNSVMGQNLQMTPHVMMNRPPNAHRPPLMNQINPNQPPQQAMINQKAGNPHPPGNQQHHFPHHQPHLHQQPQSQPAKQGQGPPMQQSNNNGQGNRPFSKQPSTDANGSLGVFSTENLIQMIHNTHPMLQKLDRMFNRQDQESNDRYYNSQGSRNVQQQRRLNPEDQYSGLMSNREKQWLLNIQLLQLNTGTPYQDDYYYTVFLDRQAKKEKLEVKEAHKANQQNHPFSQQNLNNNRYGSGDGGRERRNSSRSNSESNNVNKEGPRPHYVPTQFENSLGKLQCGSVTAPRKIIDMEVVGPEESGNTSITSTSSAGGSATPAPIGAVGGASRGARQTLLAIEALYRQLLKVEDLSEPLAIANALVLKEREEKQKALLLEQQREASERNGSLDEELSTADVPSNHFLRGIESVRRQAGETITITNSSIAAVPPSLGSAAGPRVAAAAVVTTGESETELMGGLLAGLLHDDKLAAIVNVRKGKTLVVRILTQAIPTDRWRAPLGRLWPRLVRTLPAAVRRDSALLSPLSDLFRQYLSGTEGWAPVSDLCLTLTEGAPATLPRSATPAPQQRSIMHFLITTQLGLSLLSELAWRASVLPQPAPAAWCRLARVSARLAPSPPLPHSAVPFRPMRKPLPAALVAGLTPPQVESFADLLCGS